MSARLLYVLVRGPQEVRFLRGCCSVLVPIIVTRTPGRGPTSQGIRQEQNGRSLLSSACRDSSGFERVLSYIYILPGVNFLISKEWKNKITERTDICVCVCEQVE